MLLLSEDGSIIAARDKWGRNPIVIGGKEGHTLQPVSQAVSRIWIMNRPLSRSGEIVRMTADGVETTAEAGGKDADLFFPVGILRFSHLLL